MDRQERLRNIRTGEPIDCCGLTLWPVLMWNYGEFLSCAQVWRLRLSALPYPFCTLDFFSALLASDTDGNRKGRPSGLFAAALRMLALSTRTDAADLLHPGRIRLGHRGELPTVEEIVLMQNRAEVAVPAARLPVLRQLIAEQNGLELPDEADNPDLVEQKTTSGTSSRYAEQFSVEDMIASVAYQSRLREKEILGWTVREFENRRRAIDRDKHYMLCAAAELSGMVKFPDGNPARSWLLDTVDTMRGTVPISKIAQKMGLQHQKGE